MIVLKKLDAENPNFSTVTIKLNYQTVCDLNNILAKAREENNKYDALSLEFSNLFEMLKHGFLTDFGIYKNARYFKDHDKWESWETKSKE